MKRAIGLFLSLLVAGCLEEPLTSATDGAADMPVFLDSGPTDLAVVLDGAACTRDWQCAYPDTRCNGGHCVRCLPQKGDCGFGHQCVIENGSYACVMGCGSELDCHESELGALSCCNGLCTSVDHDPANCGKCKTGCANNQQCVGGLCK